MAMYPLEPVLLGTFLSVLETGRVSRAAKALHLSQPAVTAQLRKLEDILGTALFVRSVHGVAPTEAGVRLAVYARSIRQLVAEAVAAVGPATEDVGPLIVGASMTAAAHVLPRLLAQFRGLHRGITIRVRVANTSQVVDDVRAARVPLGIVEGHRRAAAVRLEPLLDDEIVPIMGRDATFRVREAADLTSVPLLWREAGSGTRAVVERALAKAGVRRRSIRTMDIELGSTDAIIGCAIAGLGIAFVSRLSIEAQLDAGLVRLVPGLNLVVGRTFYWALPAGALGGAAALFYAFARRAAE
jgi:DNA-binding transcriptional LysR family regulator